MSCPMNILHGFFALLYFQVIFFHFFITTKNFGILNMELPFGEQKTQQLCCSRDAQIDSASRHEVGVRPCSKLLLLERRRRLRGVASGGVQHAAAPHVASSVAHVATAVAELRAANSNDKKIWRQRRHHPSVQDM